MTDNPVALILLRKKTGDSGTFGTLNLPNFSGPGTDDLLLCTGELPWRDNQPGSCVPRGTYKGVQVFSPHFQQNVIMLLGVPNRSDVEMHRGNFCGDVSKGFRSDVLGCILLGMDFGVLQGQDAVVQSTVACQKFYSYIGGNSINLTIVEDYGNIGV